MIEFSRFTLSNGLRVIHHLDTSTPMVCVNILYDVGSRDEDENHTGFAHLFEHLMFGGSVNIPNYDEPLQRVGGENNAFTSADITNYYLTLPAENIETAFWLESDRMLSLAFSEKSLDVQRNVVVEEFKQRYLNQPYGDAWLLLKPLAYKVHPYRWNTIGKEIAHIEQAGMNQVRAFFDKHYHPANAILVVAGNIERKALEELAAKWFGPIPSRTHFDRVLPAEPAQTESRFLDVARKVPSDAVYMAWHMCGRNDADYHVFDLLSDLLSSGNSSRLYQNLVKEQEVFSEISAFVTGDRDPGLFVVTGKPRKGISLESAKEKIWAEMNSLKEFGPAEKEIEKLRNRAESIFVFSNMGVMNKAMNLAYFEWLGDAADVNTELSKYRAVTAERMKQVANSYFTEANCSTLFYRSSNE